MWCLISWFISSSPLICITIIIQTVRNRYLPFVWCVWWQRCWRGHEDYLRFHAIERIWSNSSRYIVPFRAPYCDLFPCCVIFSPSFLFCFNAGMGGSSRKLSTGVGSSKRDLNITSGRRESKDAVNATIRYLSWCVKYLSRLNDITLTGLAAPYLEWITGKLVRA